MVYGYARVSAKDQNLDRQFAAFDAFGVEKDRIFSEKKSGRDFERGEYRRLLKRLRAGDLLVVKSIDRLGHSYRQIKEKGVRFGRPSVCYSNEFLSVAEDYLCKRIKLKAALQRLQIKQENFYYHIRKLRTKERAQ